VNLYCSTSELPNTTFHIDGLVRHTGTKRPWWTSIDFPGIMFVVTILVLDWRTSVLWLCLIIAAQCTWTHWANSYAHILLATNMCPLCGGLQTRSTHVASKVPTSSSSLNAKGYSLFVTISSVGWSLQGKKISWRIDFSLAARPVYRMPWDCCVEFQ